MDLLAKALKHPPSATGDGKNTGAFKAVGRIGERTIGVSEPLIPRE